MKTFCKFNLLGGVNLKPATDTLKGFMTLLLISSLAITSCNDEEDNINLPKDKRLHITVELNSPQSRTIITGTTLPADSKYGILLEGSNSDDYIQYNNIQLGQFGTKEDASTAWVPMPYWNGTTNILLTENDATLYAYWPYKENVELSAINFETASQTDYLYATPVSGINEDNSEADIIFNHALANINLTIVKSNYEGEGNVTAIAIQSDGFATAGTFNAAQATPGYTAFEDEGLSIERTVTTTLGGTATDIMVVPTGQTAPITFKVIVDGTIYTATSSVLTLVMGSSYQYTLTLNSVYMSISDVTVTEWNPVQKENLTLEKFTPPTL